ncbi:MAG TPA: methionine adenosyltransferase [Patescibacteria group bacterium]|nr:methionine adenosyltransferase [Patescibacteria group bacterium]
MSKYIFTSESVTEGHPDKVCDQVSDAILDAIYKKDPYARVACECLTTTGLLVIAGEITTTTYIDIPGIARQTIREIGYNNPAYGFDADSCGIITSIHEQSPDIAQGVVGKDASKEAREVKGAGDQGLMFGYAVRETKELMPLPIMLAHKLARRLAEVRHKKILPYLRPDGKTEVAVEYVNGKPVHLSSVVIAAQHDPDVEEKKVQSDIIAKVIKPICGRLFNGKTEVFVNSTGKFVIGGPAGDTGLTGRKIIVDTYGGHGAHGGGCFSGKDPSKVDRSASYMARYIAKNIVAARLAERCEVQLAYVIGVKDPVSVSVDTKGTGKVSDAKLALAVREVFPLDPAGIIKHLKLRRPIYRATAAYGHFGRNEANFTWEKTDKVNELKKALK